jgi:hypothetical protein
LPVQRKYLGEPYGFFVTHIGRRDAMEADSAWLAYRRVALEEDTLVDMENQILKPVPFFVPR